TNLTESDPAGHTAKQSMALRHLRESMNDDCVQQAEISGVRRNFHFGQRVDQSVKDLSGGEFESAFTITGPAHSVNNLITGTPQLEHLRNEFRRILQIRIDYNDGPRLRRHEA